MKIAMKKYLIPILAIFLLNCSDSDKDQYVLPDWQIYDYRFIDVEVSSFSRLHDDTIYNIKATNSYKFTIVDKSDQFYTVEMRNITAPNIDFVAGIDSLQEPINKIMFLVDNFSKISIPYRVQLTIDGEIVGIVDWENVFEKFMLEIFNIADSIGFSADEFQYFEHYVNTNLGMEEALRNALFKEISDVLELYNTKIPKKDSIITQMIQAPDPNSGRIVNANLHYRTLEVINGIYKIEMEIDFADDLFADSDKLINDLLESNEPSKPLNVNMENRAIYYWNSNTSWIDSSRFYMNVVTDSIEINVQSNTVLYR